MKVGIAIDAWKLPIFEKHLQQAGYVFTNKGALTPGTLLLTIETDRAAPLQVVARAANAEAAREKGRHP